ncbi:DctM TRAP-type C4-dicarboxylate transport system, small permease component [Rhabdaerophilaceae bacterium]
MTDQPQSAIEGPTPPSSLMFIVLERTVRLVAIAGGFLMLAASLLVTVSVCGRWLFNSPVEGDFEFVKMMTAVSVFCFLPLTQWNRGNIMVDTFTNNSPPSLQAALDAFWDFAYCLFVIGLAVAMVIGTREAFMSGETTMMRQVPVWPSIGMSAALIVLLVLTTLVTGLRISRRLSKSGEAL